MSKGRSSSSRTGVSGTVRTPPKAPRPLSSIPRYRRLSPSSAAIVDTETGQLYGPGFSPFLPVRSPVEIAAAPRRVLLYPIAGKRPPRIRAGVRFLSSAVRSYVVCRARKLRRRALFVFGYHGRNGFGRPYKRDAWSSYGC